ncbi:MAG: hydroxyacid dehydrogenase [Alphaproteobacteria bacterium]|nr:hydroxyacid dehydrogenase [Alphaproteobacteria bacterium]
MPHVLIAGKIHAAGIDLLEATPGITFDLVEEVSLDSYAPYLDRAEAVLIRTQVMREAEIAAAPKLRIVSRHGVGYDAIDVAALNTRAIPLAVVGDVNSRAVAEHTLMLMLAAARRTVYYDQAARQGRWNERNRFEPTELDEKSLLLLGFGRIGRRVAQLAQAFGMSVMAFDPFVSAEAMAEVGVTHVAELDQALARADYVSLHMPASPDGSLLGVRELGLMKPGATVINAARGGLVDEAALDAALRGGALAGAALDVLVDEPPAAGHPLLGNDRLTISPHNAGLTQECARRMAIAAAQNIIDCFQGRLDPKLVVNARDIGLGA